jgi:YegS/Rv2252/BmrU family lipid kinase
MKIRFILNPRSGRNRRRPWLASYIRNFITDHRLNASLVITARPGHATQLARSALADGCDRIVAVGGDGTMNEIAQVLLNSRVALGLVPCGSGNGLALHLGLPRRLQAALELAAAPSPVITAIDTGNANGHPFFNAMGCGFDAEISERFNLLERRGLPAYARTGFAAFRQRRNQLVTISSGGRHHKLDTLLIAVANSDQYGNNAQIAPGARVDDGELNLIAVSPIGFLSAMPLLARLFSGQLLGSSRILHLRSNCFVIERANAGLIHTDGETHRTSAKIQVTVCPRSLYLVLPPNSRYYPRRGIPARRHSPDSPAAASTRW